MGTAALCLYLDLLPSQLLPTAPIEPRRAVLLTFVLPIPVLAAAAHCSNPRALRAHVR